MLINRPAWLTAMGGAACACLTACLKLEDPTTATPPRLVVHAVLDARAAEQTVLVTHARTGAAGDDVPVDGETVTITLPNGNVISAARAVDAGGNCCVAGVYVLYATGAGFAPQPGATYTLHVHTPSGEEAFGTTTVPSASDVPVGDVRLFRRLQDTLRLTWPRVSGARSYELVLDRGAGTYRTFTDTAVSLPGTLRDIEGNEVFPSGALVDATVLAVDSNYYDYYRAQSDPLAGTPPSHLTGALGVFGSVVPLLEFGLNVR